MSQENDNTEDRTYRPKATYLILVVVWAVGYPFWAVSVVWNGIAEWPALVGEPMGTTPLLVLGGFLWLFSLLALAIIYDGVKNGPPQSQKETSP